MNMETYTLLFVTRMRGLIALMLMARGTQPTDEEIALLEADEITMRQLGELAHDCGCRLEIVTSHLAKPLMGEGEAQ